MKWIVLLLMLLPLVESNNKSEACNVRCEECLTAFCAAAERHVKQLKKHACETHCSLGREMPDANNKCGVRWDKFAHQGCQFRPKFLELKITASRFEIVPSSHAGARTTACEYMTYCDPVFYLEFTGDPYVVELHRESNTEECKAKLSGRERETEKVVVRLFFQQPCFEKVIHIYKPTSKTIDEQVQAEILWSEAVYRLFFDDHDQLLNKMVTIGQLRVFDEDDGTTYNDELSDPKSGYWDLNPAKLAESGRSDSLLTMSCKVRNVCWGIKIWFGATLKKFGDFW